MDPILTPLFIALGVTGSITVGASTVAVASILSQLTIGLISVGVMALLAPKPKKPEDGKIPVMQAVPPRIFAYGKTRLAGYVTLMEEHGGSLYYVAAVCAHKCNAVTGYWLNDDVVTLASDSTVNPLGDKRYTGKLISIDHRLGNASETTYSALSPLYADLVWSNTFTGDGVASLMMKCKATSSKKFPVVYPIGRPSPSIEVETAIIYDPRTDVWEYSDNTALEILHFLCFSEFGPQRSYEESILPVIDEWVHAANICDELVHRKAGGSERRYRSGGFDTTEHDTRTALNELLTACDGWLCERGDGTIILVAGKYEEPTETITDDDIVGWTIQSDVPDEYAVNEIATTFCFVDAGYSTVTVDPWEDEEDQAIRGAKRPTRLELNWVQSFSQARRLAKREMYRQKQRVRGQLVLNFGAYKKVHKRWVNVYSNTVPFLSGVTIENRKATISLSSGTVTIDYIGCGPDIDDWDAAADEGTPPSAPVIAATKIVPNPVNVTATVEAAGGESYVDVSFDDPAFSGLTFVVRWRYSPNGGWTEVAYPDPPDAVSGRITLTLSPVPQNTLIDVSVCNVSSRSSRTDFSDPITVDTSVELAAPGTPVGATGVGGVGSATISWYNPNSGTFDYAVVFRGSPGNPFSMAAPVSSHIFGSANQSVAYTDHPASGSYSYWVTAYSASGAASTPAGPITLTVT